MNTHRMYLFRKWPVRMKLEILLPLNNIHLTIILLIVTRIKTSKNYIVRMDGDLLARGPKSSQRGQSQTWINTVLPYGTNNHNLSYGNCLGDYNCCRPTNNPDFVSYHFLISITYSGCDEIKLEYDACQQEQRVFNANIMAISNNFSHTFDTTCPSAICGKVSCTFKGCEELKCPIAIKKAYI